jgi:hypothetical protein
MYWHAMAALDLQRIADLRADVSDVRHLRQANSRNRRFAGSRLRRYYRRNRGSTSRRSPFNV